MRERGSADLRRRRRGADAGCGRGPRRSASTVAPGRCRRASHRPCPREPLPTPVGDPGAHRRRRLRRDRLYRVLHRPARRRAGGVLRPRAVPGSHGRLAVLGRRGLRISSPPSRAATRPNLGGTRHPPRRGVDQPRKDPRVAGSGRALLPSGCSPSTRTCSAACLSIGTSSRSGGATTHGLSSPARRSAPSPHRAPCSRASSGSRTSWFAAARRVSLARPLCGYVISGYMWRGIRAGIEAYGPFDREPGTSS